MAKKTPPKKATPNKTPIKKSTATVSATSKPYYASVFPGRNVPLPAPFVNAVHKLEQAAGLPILVLVQNDESSFGELGPDIWNGIFNQRHRIPQGQPIGLLLDSPGGYGREAYRIARFLIRHCGGFTVFVPSYAKSAATMLALGADTLYLGKHAELGPIDAQAMSPEEGRRKSVLDEVQTLERLNAFALRSLDETMSLLIRRTGMRVDNLLPEAMSFVDNLVRPLMENIDTTRWTEMSRVLKVGEDYTARLLRRKYPDDQAEQIARVLSAKYTEHGFVIDREELSLLAARELPFPMVKPLVEIPSDEIEEIFETLMPWTQRLTVIGMLEQKK